MKQTINIRRVVWLAAFGLLGLLLVMSVKDLKHRSLNRVNINIKPLQDGSLLLDEEALLLVVEREFGHRLNKIPIRKIDVGDLEKRLEKNVFVGEAEVYIDALKRIYIDVIQREPIVRVLDSNGKGFYLDFTGIKMPVSAQASPRVLVATGNVRELIRPQDNEKESGFSELFELVRKLNQDEMLKPLVEQLDVDQEGEIFLAPKIGDQKIIFGQAENIDDKLDRLKIFYKEGLPLEGWTKYKTINLSFDGQVVCGKA
ncbi:MAG: hypothetical protein HKN16_11155 [Saprospiraceae bacterium]|nr:hypothetical protein [Saprospiraceae bacterium]